MQARVKSLRGNHPAGFAGDAVCCDDFRRQGADIRGLVTISRATARKQCLDSLDHGIWAGYVVMTTILFVIGGLTLCFLR